MRFDLGTLDSDERSLPFGLLVSLMPWPCMFICYLLYYVYSWKFLSFEYKKRRKKEEEPLRQILRLKFKFWRIKTCQPYLATKGFTSLTLSMSQGQSVISWVSMCVRKIEWNGSFSERTELLAHFTQLGYLNRQKNVKKKKNTYAFHNNLK